MRVDPDVVLREKRIMKLKKGLECFAWVILAAVLILVNAVSGECR